MSCLVCFKRGERIILGADRLLQFAENGRSWTSETRKIRQAGAWWYSPVGFVSRPGESRNTFMRVEDAIRPHVTLRDALQSLYDALEDPVRAAFKHLHDTGHGAMQLDVLIVGRREPDGPLSVGQYLAEPLTDPPYVAVRAVGTTADVSHSASIGEGPAIALMNPPRPEWLERGDAAAVRRLIELQIAATPDLVRGLDVLELTLDGARWVTATEVETV